MSFIILLLKIFGMTLTISISLGSAIIIIGGAILTLFKESEQE